MPRRRRIPQSTQDELLFNANHTCSICRERNKDVQIHHIDGTPDNNELANLIVLCLDCHSRVTGTRGLGKAYSPGEVRRFKRSWEQNVHDARQPSRPQPQYQKQTLSQIDVIVCEILALDPRSNRVAQLLEVLFELHLYRGDTEVDRKIIEGLKHIALMSGFRSSRLQSLVADKLYEMCFHYVGPEDLPMDAAGLDLILEAIDGLGSLTSFNAEFGRGIEALDDITENAQNFFEIGMWYENPQICDKVIKLHREALDGCYDKGDVIGFPEGREALRRSLEEQRGHLGEEQPSWKAQHATIQEILAADEARASSES
jgi:hypothetical protein